MDQVSLLRQVLSCSRSCYFLKGNPIHNHNTSYGQPIRPFCFANRYIEQKYHLPAQLYLTTDLMSGNFADYFPSGLTSRKSHSTAVSYTHLRAHETVLDLVCRLLLEKKKK